jgi:hypothetical protein
VAKRDEGVRGVLVDRLGRQAEYGRTVLEEIDKQRQQAESEGLIFTAPTEEELLKKLQGARSPFISGQGWSGSAPTDGTLSYSVTVTNPDPDIWSSLYVHVFVGPATLVSDVADAVRAVDTRFPRLTMPEVFGLDLDPGAFSFLQFSVTIPSVEASNYLGNSVLFKANYHDSAQYLDRALFVFEVTP